MPDLKISQLTSATTPLAGTEVLPIVQSSTTVKVAVSDLTAGRSVSASALTASSGNLTFSGTAQRITGDFSNATVADRLAFQTSTVNGSTTVNILPNGTGNNAIVEAYNSSDPANAGILQFRITNTVAQINASLRGTGAYVPLTFVTGGSEAMRIDTSRRVGIGGSPSVAGVQLTVLGGGTQLSPGTTAQEGLRIQRATGYATFTGINNDNNAYNGLQFFTSASAAVTVDTSGNVGIGTASPGERLNVNSTGAEYAIQWNSTGSDNWVIASATNRAYIANKSTPAEVLTILNGGNVGIGTASPSKKLDVFNSGTTTTDLIVRNGTVSLLSFVDSGAGYTGTTTNHPLLITTNNTERVRISADGNVGIGTTSFGASSQVVLAIANATAVPTGNPTGGGVLYVEAGALKYRGSSGTVTTIANA